MADTWYAWSDIQYGGEVEKDTGVHTSTKTLKAGEKVTASALGVDEDNFNALVEAGSVRNYPYPKDMAKEGFAGSPVEYLRSKRDENDEAVLGSPGSYFAVPEEAYLAGGVDPTASAVENDAKPVIKPA